jgi:hypothetical protein
MLIWTQLHTLSFAAYQLHDILQSLSGTLLTIESPQEDNFEDVPESSSPDSKSPETRSLTGRKASFKHDSQRSSVKTDTSTGNDDTTLATTTTSGDGAADEEVNETAKTDGADDDGQKSAPVSNRLSNTSLDVVNLDDEVVAEQKGTVL